MCLSIVACIVPFACGAADTGAEDTYFNTLMSNTAYSRKTAELNIKANIPKHDPQDIENLFAEHKAVIVRAIAPYLRTYDGGEYPQISISVYGLPLPPDGTQVGFSVGVKATTAPKKGRGIRPMLDDSYGGHVVFDTAKGSVASVEMRGGQLRSVPKEEYEAALALAEELDPQYKDSKINTMHVRWLPKWYVAEYIVPRNRTPGSPAWDYGSITEETAGHVVVLPFRAGGVEGSRDKTRYHIVTVDMAAKRVLGIYKTIVNTGPVFGR